MCKLILFSCYCSNKKLMIVSNAVCFRFEFQLVLSLDITYIYITKIFTVDSGRKSSDTRIKTFSLSFLFSNLLYDQQATSSLWSLIFYLIHIDVPYKEVFCTYQSQTYIVMLVSKRRFRFSVLSNRFCHSFIHARATLRGQ